MPLSSSTVPEGCSQRGKSCPRRKLRLVARNASNLPPSVPPCSQVFWQPERQCAFSLLQVQDRSSEGLKESNASLTSPCTFSAAVQGTDWGSNLILWEKRVPRDPSSASLQMDKRQMPCSSWTTGWMVSADDTIQTSPWNCGTHSRHPFPISPGHKHK